MEQPQKALPYSLKPPASHAAAPWVTSPAPGSSSEVGTGDCELKSKIRLGLR